MKKAYQKPELFYEDFALQERLAASCDILGNQQDQYSCYGYYDPDWPFGNRTIISKDLGTCDVSGGCYQVPEFGMLVFASI